MNPSAWNPVGKTKTLGASDLRTLLKKVALQETSQPRLVGDGHPTFSTSLAVDLWPRLRWDTNNFYGRLAVSIDASRRDIAAAYLKADGHSSVLLTHILKTLIDPELRLRYDATPLGCVWADDPTLYQIDTSDDDGVALVHQSDDWACYSLGLPDESIDWSLLAVWRTEVALAWWASGKAIQIAVGQCHPDIESHLRMVGSRKVAFLQKGVAIKDACEYARRLSAVI